MTSFKTFTQLPVLFLAAFALAGCGGAAQPAAEDAASAFGRPRATISDELCIKGSNDTEMLRYVSVDGTCTKMFAPMVVSRVGAAVPAVSTPQGVSVPLASNHARFTWPTFVAWAVAAYPQFFRGRTVDGVLGEYTYRHWPETGYYLGIGNAERLYALGPATDDEILFVGTLTELLCAVYPGNCLGSSGATGGAADIRGDASTTSTLALNTPAASVIESAGDEDWFAVDLAAGMAYTFDMEGSATGKGTLTDPYLKLYSSTGQLVSSNDDVDYPSNRNARIRFTAASSGRYYLAAQGFSSTGSYVLTGVRASTDTAAGGADIAANRSTTATLVLSTPYASVIEQAGDEDWFAVQLAAGTTYTFNLEGQSTAKGTLVDPYLRLYDSVGQLVSSNDDVSYPSNLNARLQLTPSSSGWYYVAALAAPVSGDGTGTYQLTASGGSSTIPTPTPVPETGRVAAVQPVTAAVASGSVSYRFTSISPALTGSFTPSADGFETEFSQTYKLYRWIDRTRNQRLELKKQHLQNYWTITLYDDTVTELGYYPMGFGGYGYPRATLASSDINFSVSGGTVTDKAIAVSFSPKSSSTALSMLNGTLSGSAPHHLWSQFELPRSSSGTVSWNGITRSVVSTTVEDDTRGGDPSIDVYLEDGIFFRASMSGGTPPKLIQTRTPERVTEFQCGPSLGGACDYTVSKTGTYSSIFRFSTLLYSGSRTGPSTRLEGSVAVDQGYSTLTVNGFAFPMITGVYGVAAPSARVESVGDITKFSLASSNLWQSPAPEGLAVGGVSVWRRGNKIVQVMVPGPNLSVFICTETASSSRSNVATYAGPEFTIPACPPVTALFPLGGNVRGFEFSNFRLNAAPSNFAVPLSSVVLNGVLMAKGL